MAEKKIQHFVPKVHLKNFATDNQKKQITIWLPKQDKVIFGASVRDQCSKSYFYGKDLRIENFFNSPEGIFGNIVKRLSKTRKPDSEALRNLLYLWLLQHVRTETAVKEQLLLISAMREKITLGQEKNDELNEWLGPPISSSEALEMILDKTNELFEIISDLRCVLLINVSKTGFVMSDNPAISSNKLVLKRYMKYRNWGIDSAGFYNYMPLTPQLGFLAFDRHVYELIGRNGGTCVLKDKDVVALNQLTYLNSNNLIVLPPFGDTSKIIGPLKEVSSVKLDSNMRVNLAVEDERQNFDGGKRFSMASDDEFKDSESGLIHIERVPTIVSNHLPKLLIKPRPRFIDTESGAGLKRYGSSQ